MEAIFMFQRQGKSHKAALVDSDKISYKSLVEFCKKAKVDLESAGEEDSALRFELLEEWLRKDFKGSFSYNSKMIGL
jgi:hypothetical protein